MSEEVVQWLGEINRLKQQLAALQQDLKTSQTSEASWRQRYTEEAQQRRTEARLAKEQLEQLQLEIDALQRGNRIPPDSPEVMQALHTEIAAIADLDHLKERLIQVSQERNQALQALQQERDNHEQTRRSLTSVINDTIEQLGKMKKDNP